MDVAHALDRRERLLERIDDLVLHRGGRRALELDGHADERELHVGVAVDAEAHEAEHAERGERERHHPGQDGALDREVGKAHSSAPSVVAGLRGHGVRLGVAHGDDGRAVDEPAVAAPHHAVARRDVAAHLDAARVVHAGGHRDDASRGRPRRS